MKTLFISTYNELITIGLLIDEHLINKKEKISNRDHSIYTVCKQNPARFLPYFSIIRQ